MKSSSEHVNCVGVDAKYWKQRSRHILVFCKHPKILQRRVKADMIPPTIKDLQMETFKQILQTEESKIVNTVQFSSVAQSCPTLCDPMNRSTSGLPVHHQLPEFTQTHIHQVRDAIQPSHPRSSPSPPAPNPSQRQSLFQWVNSSHEVAKVLEFQL